jgi:hypothetical protein
MARSNPLPPAPLRLVGDETASIPTASVNEVDGVELCREIMLDLSRGESAYGHELAWQMCREIGASSVFFCNLSAAAQNRLRSLGLVELPELKLTSAEE